MVIVIVIYYDSSIVKYNKLKIEYDYAYVYDFTFSCDHRMKSCFLALMRAAAVGALDVTGIVKY